MDDIRSRDVRSRTTVVPQANTGLAACLSAAAQHLRPQP